MADLNQTGLGEIKSLRHKIIEMLEKAQTMFRTSFDGFIKHDIGILNQVLKDEGKITGIYNDLTASTVEIAKKNLSKKTEKMLVDLVDIICAIERIGDSCVGLTERIEYKIRENLLFSEAAVEEYEDLHGNVDQILSKAIDAMRTEDKKLAKKILGNERALYALIDKCRASHIERSAKGICDDWARIRYLDMLDFTEEVVHHCMEIAGKLRGV